MSIGLGQISHFYSPQIYNNTTDAKDQLTPISPGAFYNISDEKINVSICNCKNESMGFPSASQKLICILVIFKDLKHVMNWH